MLKIISKEQFKDVPWKNGKGSTLELAISPNGTLDNFEWRLSIAKVEHDGVFSDFSGYTRNLVLIEGDGIILHHHDNHIDHLQKRLEFSTFDGSNKTIAKLNAGAITDFNLMTRTKCFDGAVETYNGNHRVILNRAQICFIYGLSRTLKIETEAKKYKQMKSLPAGDLFKITDNNQTEIRVSGENFIVVYINKLRALDHT